MTAATFDAVAFLESLFVPVRKSRSPAQRAAALLAQVHHEGLRLDLREFFEERAAICEYHGELARERAELHALNELRTTMRAMDLDIT